MIKKVAVIGLGYVGLPTYVALKKTNLYDVVGYTRSQKKVDNINRGVSPIDDADVEEYLKPQSQSHEQTKRSEGRRRFHHLRPHPGQRRLRPRLWAGHIGDRAHRSFYQERLPLYSGVDCQPGNVRGNRFADFRNAQPS